jgi:urease subunit alpha
MTFVAPPAVEERAVAQLGPESSIVAIADTRALGESDMPQNTACPEIRVEPDSFRLRADGEENQPQPVDELALAQRHDLF